MLSQKQAVLADLNSGKGTSLPQPGTTANIILPDTLSSRVVHGVMDLALHFSA
jgi:hypothetical protein